MTLLLRIWQNSRHRVPLALAVVLFRWSCCSSDFLFLFSGFNPPF
jgi:hypothetical protein